MTVLVVAATRHDATQERAVLRAVGGKDGDYRDWAAISAWAREIA